MAVNYDALDIVGPEDLQELSPLPGRSPLQSCERAQAADELQNASLQNMEEMTRWEPSSPGVCKEVETCSGPQRNQHTAASPKGNSETGSCTSGEYDVVVIGGEEDLQELSPLPGRSPLQSCERAQAADELQNASLQNMEEMTRWEPSSPEACKEVETCSGPQRNQHTAASPKGNSETGSCTSGEYDVVVIGGEEDLQELSPLPERSPLQSCERAQAADELQNASLQNMEEMPRWNPSSPGACKKVEACSGPQRYQHTATSSSLLRGYPKDCEPAEHSFCLPSQTTFSTKSEPETIRSAALEMLTTAALKKGPKEVLERESEGNSETGSCTSGEYDVVSIGGQEDLQELSPLPERSPLQSCERAQAADELQNASLQNMEEMLGWNPSSPGDCKEVETCSGPQRYQHTAASPNSNSDSGSCTSGEHDVVVIGGQEDLQELSPLPERSPLQTCERAQPADELQSVSLQNMEEMPRWEPSSPGDCKEIETCCGPQRYQHTAASPNSNSDSGSSMAVNYDALDIVGQEDLQELSPLPERSPLQSCERAQAADELQNASLQNMEMWPRWNPSSPEACKELETCSSPQRNQHTAASSSLLRSSPKGCEPGELSLCLPSQTTFSTKSEPETIRSAALEMLTAAALKNGPREGLERESEGNSETGSCTSGEYDVVVIGGQEDLQELSPLPERSPLQSCERAQAADELQNASLQNMDMWPRWNPRSTGVCKEVETCSGPQRNQHTAASPKGNSDSGSCTSGEYDVVVIGGQEDLQELSPLPGRSPLQSCERAQPADELQNASLQKMEMWPRWNPSSPGVCKEVETCSSPQRNQHTAASPKGNSDSGSCTSGEYDVVVIGGQEDLQELSPLPGRSPLQSCERAQAADELQNASLQKMEMWPRWNPSSPGVCKEVETCSGPQRNQHTAVSPKGNSDSGSSMAGNCDPLDIVGQEDLPELSPLPERSPLQSCERTQAADELQNAHQQPKVQLTLSGEAGNTSLQIYKKERGSDEPQSPMAAEPQSPASWDKGVPREWKSEETEPRYECSYCHQFFENQDQLVRHENAHKRRPFLCTHCGKGFPSAHARTIHTRIHTGEKPFKCPECDFRCSASTNLNKHRRTHSRESPHLCVLCGQSFWFSHSLAVHWQMHSGKETYTCADCGQMFLRKNLLNLHRKYKHQSGAV
ncbi:uncharacterized protein LOC128408882 [Podarcis raffonei]|uniref:uncharacterized protein LOC128408882 n=1 Tax=Podarcis raffonei TaxID=65483 RepID=UPI00232908F1|nr:uncharacterized protein LOC128408882 [Podarcis raffonei]